MSARNLLKPIAVALALAGCGTPPNDGRLVPAYYEPATAAEQRRNAGVLSFLTVTLGVAASAAMTAILKK